MDNVTHGLFGYALAQALPSAHLSERQRSALTWTSVCASNAPDLDLIMRFFVHDQRLAYLVHHRGHTHTLLWALPLGLLCGGVIALCNGVRGWRSLAPVLGLGALAAGLHIFLDAFNNYGVHPFHPWESRWFYGDAVFIVEPLLFVVLLPPLVCGAQSRLGRIIGWGLVALLLWLLLWAGPLSLVHGAGLAVLLVCSCALFWRVAQRAALALLLMAGLVAGLFGASQLAEGRFVRALAQARPVEQVLDVARSPLPGNPLCWQAALVSVDRAGGYHGRVGALTLLPDWLALADCGLASSAAAQTAPTVLGTAVQARGVYLGPEFLGRREDLQALWRTNCRAARALRFMRIPYWTAGQAGVIGDLRYDREPELGFAEIPLQGSCDDPDAGWTPPRADLLTQ